MEKSANGSEKEAKESANEDKKLSSKQQKFLDDLESDQEGGFKEFLEVMRPRQAAASRTWGNDDITAVKGKENQTVSTLVPADPEDDLYQDLPSKYHGEEDEEDVASEPATDSGEPVDSTTTNSIAFDSTLSDLDYMKLKMKESLEKSQKEEAKMATEPVETVKVNPGRLAFLQEAGVVGEGVINVYEQPQVDQQQDNDPAQQAQNNSIDQQQPVIAQEQSMYTETPSPELIADTGRIMVRNLAYSCTYEDLETNFKKYGKIAEIHLPIDKITKESKGYAFILFMLPEDAVRAFTSADKSIFQGRILEIVAAKEKPKSAEELLAERGQDTFKSKKERDLKASASNDFNWNSLFMNVSLLDCFNGELLIFPPCFI